VINSWSTLLHTQQTQDRNIHALRGVLSRDPNNQTAVDPRIRSHGRRDQIYLGLVTLNYKIYELRMILGFVQKRIKISVIRISEI